MEKAGVSDGGFLYAVLNIICSPDQAFELIDRLSELLKGTSTAHDPLLSIYMGIVAVHNIS